MLVRLQVRGQVLDPLGEDGDLYFRGARILPVDGVRLDQFVFAFLGQQPCLGSSFALRVNICKVAQHMTDGNFTSRRAALILLSGLPGTGKTTFALALGGKLAFEHVESDAIRRGLAATPTYTSAESAAVFAKAESLARAALDSGRNALIDATNLSRRDRKRFLQLARSLGANLVAVRLTAPEATVRERLATPRAGFSQADTGIYDLMRDRGQAFAEPVVVVDTRYPLDAAIDLVLRLIHDERSERHVALPAGARPP